MRWYSLKGVPRGSKNGSGATIRIRMQCRDSRTKCSRVTIPPHHMSAERPAAAEARRRYTIAALKLTVSIALLALLFSRLDTSRLWEGARHASVPWLIVALAVYALTVAASTWRWHVLLKAQN